MEIVSLFTDLYVDLICRVQTNLLLHKPMVGDLRKFTGHKYFSGHETVFALFDIVNWQYHHFINGEYDSYIMLSE